MNWIFVHASTCKFTFCEKNGHIKLIFYKENFSNDVTSFSCYLIYIVNHQETNAFDQNVYILYNFTKADFNSITQQCILNATRIAMCVALEVLYNTGKHVCTV